MIVNIDKEINSFLLSLADHTNKEEINKINSIHESFITQQINFSTNDKVEVIFHEYKSILNEKLGHIQK